MYLKSLKIERFRAFRHSEVQLHYPEAAAPERRRYPNVDVLLGNRSSRPAGGRKDGGSDSNPRAPDFYQKLRQASAAVSRGEPGAAARFMNMTSLGAAAADADDRPEKL